MNQNCYLGVDYHKNYSFLSLLDFSGKKLKEGRVSNHKENLKDFLKHIDNQNILAVMEAGRNWTVMYDLLEEIVKDVKLAHPLKVKIIAEAKSKTDKIDSEALAHLLRTNLLSEAYVPTMEARTARQILKTENVFCQITNYN